jgi:hypothetical protein
MENKLNKEIADIAPLLASMDKQNPFKVPEGYFSSMENRLLDSIESKSVFQNTVPAGYFDHLAENVIEKIHADSHTRVIPMYKKRWLSIAASLIIILGAGYLLNAPSNTPDNTGELVLDIQPEDALEYLIENDNLYLTDLLNLNLLEEDMLSETSNVTNFENTDIDILLNELDPEDLEELL